jgi:alpha-ribazole phosphatase
MILHVLRHGQTKYNLLGLCNGDPRRDVHLTEAGKAQAKTAAEALKNRSIERIFVSELPRTRETADIINHPHGVAIEQRPELNDIRSGFEDRPVTEYLAAVGHDRLHLRANGGESLLDYKARVLAFVRWLRNQAFNEVALVAHEETLRVLYAHFHHLEDREMEELGFANCEALRFEL